MSRLLTGGPVSPEITKIIIPVKMHSYWYWLTHRHIATPLILYQNLDLNNTKRAYICSYTEQVTLWSKDTINYPGLGNKFRYVTQAAGFFLYTMLDVTHRMPLLRNK